MKLKLIFIMVPFLSMSINSSSIQDAIKGELKRVENIKKMHKLYLKFLFEDPREAISLLKFIHEEEKSIVGRLDFLRAIEEYTIVEHSLTQAQIFQRKLDYIKFKSDNLLTVR